MNKKQLLLVLVIGAAAMLASLLKFSLQARATHVAIDPNLSVTPNIISFQTVFPGEVQLRPLHIGLSEAFLASPEHDDVEYRILQRPKPRRDDPAEREYCESHPDDYGRCYPSLCPYLSKDVEQGSTNDRGVPAFHDPTATSSIAFGRLAKSEEDIEDDWIIDLHVPCFRGECDQANVIPPQYQLDPALEGEVFGCDLVVEVLRISFNETCPLCERDGNGNSVIVEVSNNVLIDFNTNPPTYSGDPVLRPYVSYDRSGPTPDTWKTVFDLGGKGLRVKPGARIEMVRVGGGNARFAPGLVIQTRCTLETGEESGIIVNSINRKAGDILVHADGNITLRGEIRNQVSGTVGLPGNITVASTCGDLVQERTSIIQDLGVDPGARNINLLACERGDIVLEGLVMGRARAHVPPLDLNRPHIRVAAFGGAVTVKADTALPLYNDITVMGTKYDLWGGLLSWVLANTHPGSVEIQAANDVVVKGHGRDNRKSFGAVAAITSTADPHGGKIDVRSTNGTIQGTNRAFDTAGRNTAGTNFAAVALHAAHAISLTRPGAQSSFNPVVDASGEGPQSRGGTNTLRAYQQNIVLGPGSLVSAQATGSGGTPGANFLTACTGITNSTNTVPADTVPGDDSGMCAPTKPAALWSGCEAFGL